MAAGPAASLWGGLSALLAFALVMTISLLVRAMRTNNLLRDAVAAARGHPDPEAGSRHLVDEPSKSALRASPLFDPPSPAEKSSPKKSKRRGVRFLPRPVRLKFRAAFAAAPRSSTDVAPRRTPQIIMGQTRTVATQVVAEEVDASVAAPSEASDAWSVTLSPQPSPSPSRRRNGLLTRAGSARAGIATFFRRSSEKQAIATARWTPFSPRSATRAPRRSFSAGNVKDVADAYGPPPTLELPGPSLRGREAAETKKLELEQEQEQENLDVIDEGSTAGESGSSVSDAGSRDGAAPGAVEGPSVHSHGAPEPTSARIEEEHGEEPEEQDEQDEQDEELGGAAVCDEVDKGEVEVLGPDSVGSESDQETPADKAGDKPRLTIGAVFWPAGSSGLRELTEVGYLDASPAATAKPAAAEADVAAHAVVEGAWPAAPAGTAGAQTVITAPAGPGQWELVWRRVDGDKEEHGKAGELDAAAEAERGAGRPKESGVSADEAAGPNADGGLAWHRSDGADSSSSSGDDGGEDAACQAVPECADRSAQTLPILPAPGLTPQGVLGTPGGGGFYPSLLAAACKE